MASLVERLRSSLSASRPKSGRVVTVYDGRSWPVVKCGAVYVTDEEKARSVTKNIVNQSTTSLGGKKPKSSKYSIAVGSSFGHVHTFLKDSDQVLKTLDGANVEDKCLMLIRKPKSASKQMLKAHSWSNLTSEDMHLRQADGSLATSDPYHQFKSRTKKSPRSAEISNPSPSNQKSPFKGPINNSSSFKELSLVTEQEEGISASFLSSWEPQKLDSSTDGNHSTRVPPQMNYSLTLSHSLSSHSSKNSFSNEKSKSHIDLRHVDKENNIPLNRSNPDKMGSGLGVLKSRPKGPPPSVPQKKESRKSDNVPSVQNSSLLPNDERNNNNVTSKLTLSLHTPQNTRVTESDNTKMSHIVYNDGFKQDLHAQSEQGRRVTSSPKNVIMPTKTGTNSVNSFYSGYKSANKSRPEPQYYPNGLESTRMVNNEEKVQKMHVDKKENVRLVGNETYRPSSSEQQSRNLKINKSVKQDNNFAGPPKPARSKQNSSQAYSDSDNKMRISDSHSGSTIDSRHNSRQAYSDRETRQGISDIRSENSSESRQNNRQTYSDRKTRPGISDIHSENSSECRQNSQLAYSDRDTSLGTGDYQRHSGNASDSISKRKSMGDLAHQKPLSVEKEESVFRAQSMSDLSAGYTFSLVGQKKAESYLDITSEEFTGSKLTQHFRKYREIKKESKHGSLPFRGKAIDEDLPNSVQNIEHLIVSSTESSKPSHYSSLQHLPLGAKEPRQVIPTRNHAPTPAKPRRSLPQVPASDVQDKMKQYTEVVRQKINGSCSRSNSSRSSNTSTRGSIAESHRVSTLCQTPSDREVSALLNSSNGPESHWPNSNSSQQHYNNQTDSSVSMHRHNSQTLLPDVLYESSMSHNQPSGYHRGQPPGGRLSDSGQTTLTSQSTIDSGYITNDPDQESFSTSNYARSLKESAQSMYASNKLFKSPKGDNSINQVSQNSKGGNYQHPPKESTYSHIKSAKEAHTKSWVDSYPHLSIIETPYKPRDIENSARDKTDNNNNRNGGYRPESEEQLLIKQNSGNNNNKSQHDSTNGMKSHLTHHLSDISEVDKYNGPLKRKGKSLSMSQGLNLIEAAQSQSGGSFLSKSQPKFTGSLKDLLGNNKQIVAIETQKTSALPSSNTLPNNHRFSSSGNLRLESSLKCFGKPSLFQLLQNYNLYAVRVKLMDNFDIMENIRMIECEVVLPPVWVNGAELSPTVASPKGSYARLGGPNSAFRPVTGGSQLKTVSMVTVMEVSNPLTACIQSGTLIKGDLIVEVNETLVIGESIETVSTSLHGCYGELLLTVARDKARVQQQLVAQNGHQGMEEELREKEQRIVDLATELKRKERTLQQLSALLPWKQVNNRGRNSDGMERDGDVCSLSEDEFIV